MTYTVDRTELKQASRFLKGTVQALEKSQFRAVNKTASKTKTAASKNIRSQVRLSASFVNQNLKVSKKATKDNPEAVISARKRPVRLARYGAKQLTMKARGAKGDPLRGIAAGRKQAGVSVAVKKGGSREKLQKAFLLPFKSANTAGVFIRTGKSRTMIKQLYGPSVYKLFESYRETAHEQISAELQAEYRRQLRFALGQEAKR